jgi:hypothetical protein
MGGWSANHWPLPQRLVKSDRQKMAGDETRENRASQEAGRRVARDCRISNHRRVHRQHHRIQGVPWLMGIVGHGYEHWLD